jgi:hypothetical protein
VRIVLTARPKGDLADRRIRECWQAGMRSAGEIGRRIGLDPMSVGRRIARMVKTGAWPFAPSPKGGRAASPTRLEPSGAMLAELSLRIGRGLHERLRAHCRDTGATVSEAVTEALDGFLPRKLDDPRLLTRRARDAR